MMTKNPRGRGRPSSRDKILDAALALVAEVGPDALTLDGVAARAGVSKGGLLYHYRFKEELLLAANERLVHRRVAARKAEFEKLPDGPSRALKAYVLASVHDRMGNDAISTRMMGAGPSANKTSEPIRSYFKERFPPFSDDVGFDRAALVHVATEGLWFMDVLRLSPFSKQQRSRIIDLILAIADSTEPAAPTVRPLKQASREIPTKASKARSKPRRHTD